MNAPTTFPDTATAEPAQPDEAPSAALAEMTSFPREAQAAFLSALAECGQARRAARAAGVSHQTVYRARRACAVFRRGWDAALIAARALAEDVLATRALDGVEEEIFYRGELIGTRRRYDSRLLLAHLARLDRLTGAGQAAAGPSAAAGAEAFAEDFDGALERFVAGSDTPEQDPDAPVETASPGQCNTRSTALAEAGEKDGSRARRKAHDAWYTEEEWCPIAQAFVLPHEALANRMDVARPDWVRAPWEFEDYADEDIESAQVEAYKAGEEKWYLALPPEDCATGTLYRMAEPGEMARSELNVE